MNGWVAAWNGTAEAVLERLWGAAWQGGLTLALAWLLCLCVPRMHPALRTWLWRLAYLKLLVALFWTSPVPLPVLPPVAGNAAPSRTAIERQPLAPLSAAQPGTGGEPASSLPPGTSVAATPPPTALSWQGMLAAAWLVGLLFCLVRLLRDGAKAARFRRTCAQLTDAELSRACSELCFRLNLPRLPVLLAAPGDGSPVLMGALRPAVVLPEAVVSGGMTPELRLLLAHELAHWKRQDLLWAWLPSLVHTLFWFHPAVWLANREWRLAQELACDELALQATEAPPRDYGAVLVRVAKRSRLTPQPGLSTVGIEESPETLKRRLGAISHRGATPPVVLAAGTVCLVLGGVSGLVPWQLVPRPSAPLRTADASSGARPNGSNAPAEANAGALDEAGSTPRTSASPGPAGNAPSSARPSPGIANGLGAPAGSQGMPAPPAPASQPAALRYGWKVGRSYPYQLTVEAESDGYRETSQGNVTYRPTEADGGFALAVNGVLSPAMRVPTGGGFPGPHSFGPSGRRFGPLFAQGEVRLDPRGRLTGASGEGALPYGLGDLARVLILELPAATGDTWESRNEVVVSPPEDASAPYRPFPSRMGGPRFGPFSNGPSQLRAIEECRFRRTELRGETMLLERSLSLSSLEQMNGEPRLHLSGEGPVVWDLKAGVVRSLEFRGTLSEVTPYGVKRTPVKLVCRAGAPDAAATGSRQGGGRYASASRPAPAPPVDIAHELQELKEGDKFRRMSAAGRLESAKPDRLRAEVAKELGNLLTDPDGFVRQSAARALGIWGTADSVPLLLKALEEDSSFAVHWAALAALGKLGDARAVEPLTRRVIVDKDRGFSSQALQAMGPVAESAGLKLLREQDGWVRLEGCRVLKSVGGRESLAPLEAAGRDSDGLVAQAARDALETVRARLR